MSVPDSSFSFHVLLPDDTSGSILVVQEAADWTLPFFEVEAAPGVGLLSVGVANRAAAARFGIEVRTVHSVHVRDPDAQPYYHVFTLEPSMCRGEPPAGSRWLSRAELPRVRISPPVFRTVLETWFTEQESSERLVPCWVPGWREAAEMWARAEIRHAGLGQAGPLEQVRSWYLASVFRLPTATGDIYFKAQARSAGGEAAITEALALWRPERFPRVLACDPDRSWLLMRDLGGVSLDGIWEIEPWEATAREYAQLQVDSLTLWETGHPPPLDDRTARTMRGRIRPLFAEADELMAGLRQRLTGDELEQLQRAAPRLDELCAEVMAYGVPAALEHGDFHAANVRMTPEGPLFYDWSEASVSHPFFGLTTLLDAPDWLPADPQASARIRDAYLEPWTAFEPIERCRTLFGRLGPLWDLEAALQARDRIAGWRRRISCPPLPFSGAEWSLRQQQYSLATYLRKLLALAA